MSRIRQARRRLGLSQEELADESGVSAATIVQVELGHREPQGRTLRKLAVALGVEVADLVEEEVDASPKGQAPLPLENGPAGPPGREDPYQPWLEFINRYADRWDEKIARGVIEPAAVDDFIDVLDAVKPTLGKLALQEKREQPPGYPYTFGPIMGKAITRLLEEVLEGVIGLYAKSEKTDELARLRRSREALSGERDKAASG